MKRCSSTLGLRCPKTLTTAVCAKTLLVVFRRGRQPRCAHVLPEIFCGHQHFMFWPWFLCSRAPWLTSHLRCRVRHARSSFGVAQNHDVAESGFWRRNISSKMDASLTLLSRQRLTALAEVVIKAESPSITRGRCSSQQCPW